MDRKIVTLYRESIDRAVLFELGLDVPHGTGRVGKVERCMHACLAQTDRQMIDGTVHQLNNTYILIHMVPFLFPFPFLSPTLAGQSFGIYL